MSKKDDKPLGEAGGWLHDVAGQIPNATIREVTFLLVSNGDDIGVKFDDGFVVSFAEARTIIARLLAPMSDRHRVNACLEAINFLNMIGRSPGDFEITPSGGRRQ